MPHNTASSSLLSGPTMTSSANEAAVLNTPPLVLTFAATDPTGGAGLAGPAVAFAVAVAAVLSWKVVPLVTDLTVAPVGMLALPLTDIPATTPVVLATVTRSEPDTTEPPVKATDVVLSEPAVIAHPRFAGVPEALFAS